jgi:predicted transcriptional regulator
MATVRDGAPRVGEGETMTGGEGFEPDLRRTSWTAREIMRETFAPPRIVVDGLVLPGATFLGGAPKIGKSFLVLGLCVAVAAGGRALGSVAVERGEALYLALEDSARRLQHRLRTVLDGTEAPEGFYIETAWPRVDEGGIERLARFLDDHPRCRLVVVDVWPRLRPAGTLPREYFRADYDAVVPLQALAIERDVAILVNVHTRKAESADFIDAIQGTLGTAAAADTLIVVKRARGEATATLHVTGRDVEERALALRFEPTAGTWTSLGDAARYALGDTRRELLEALEAHGSLTPKAAAELTGLDRANVRQALARMAKDGQVEAAGGLYTPVTPVIESPNE